MAVDILFPEVLVIRLIQACLSFANVHPTGIHSVLNEEIHIDLQTMFCTLLQLKYLLCKPIYPSIYLSIYLSTYIYIYIYIYILVKSIYVIYRNYIAI